MTQQERKPPTVTLGKHAVTLTRPRSMLEVAAMGRTEAQIAAADDSLVMSLAAAALVCCWPEGKAWPGKRPKTWSPRVRLEEYGQQAFDDLCRQVSPVEVIRAAGLAYEWAVSHMIPADAIEAAEDFSEPPPGG